LVCKCPKITKISKNENIAFEDCATPYEAFGKQFGTSDPQCSALGHNPLGFFDYPFNFGLTEILIFFTSAHNGLKITLCPEVQNGILPFDKSKRCCSNQSTEAEDVKIKKPTAPGVPKRSPIQVLSGPNVA
jgi:hypothetical protein